jgi:hypothetical protein
LKARPVAATNRLILATDGSAAGCLKASGIADRVTAIDCGLVAGPVPPVADPLAFFAERKRLAGTDNASSGEDDAVARFCGDWRKLIQLANDFDHVEIWADPEPNSQLQLVQLLDWLSAYPHLIRKLSLANVDFRIGERTPESVAALGLRAQEVCDVQMQIARLAWRALQQPTPEAWFALLRDDLQVLPYLRSTVERMLEELPAADTALTFSQAQLLEIISNGPTGPVRAMADYLAGTSFRALDYWELGKRLHDLADGEAPAVVGLDDGPFDLVLRDDGERYERYKRMKLSLSDLGQALLKREADFSRHNTIERWWGGTRLTNDRLWRWDAASRVLIPPT